MLIQCEKRARQVIDYESLSWGKIHPMDIDGILEFDGKKLLVLEYKSYNAPPMKYGQELTLTNVADNWIKASKVNDSLVVVAVHNTDADEIVEGGYAKVTRVYYRGRWYDYSHVNRSVRDVVGNYIKEEIETRAN